MKCYVEVDGNSILLIASNIAHYYKYLKNYDFAKKFGTALNERQLLYATAILDSKHYLDKNIITYEDLRKAVISAESGIIRTPYIEYEYCDKSEDVTDQLETLTISLETIFFSDEKDVMDNYFGSMGEKQKQLLDDLLDSKYQIGMIISGTMMMSSKNFYKAAKIAVKHNVKNKEFINEVYSF